MQVPASHFGKTNNMKRIIIISLIAVMAAFLGVNASAQDKKQNSSKEEVTFIVGLHCQNCVKKVQANLPFEKGVEDIKVTLDDHTVWIQYDPKKTDSDKLKAAIEKMGYEVKGTK